jgi:hypothetical protein
MQSQPSTRHASPHDGTFWWRTLPNGRRVFSGRAQVNGKFVYASLTLGNSERETERRVRATIREKVAKLKPPPPRIVTVPPPTQVAPDGREFVRLTDPKFRRWIYERDGGICGICRHPVEFDSMHVDHVRPRIEGGNNHVTNLRVSHAECNLLRGQERRQPIYA